MTPIIGGFFLKVVGEADGAIVGWHLQMDFLLYSQLSPRLSSQSPSEGNDIARSLDKGPRYPDNSDIRRLFLM